MRGWRRVHHVLLLDVVGHDYAGDGPLGQGDAHRPIDEVAGLGGIGGHVHVLVRHVLEQGDQVDLLLVAAAQRHPVLLADDRHHRLVVELGVVEPLSRWIAPGPEVAMQTPASPVHLAWPQAMKADISSWRACTNSIRSVARESAPRKPLMPSPG
jgi:hypothetical protein